MVINNSQVIQFNACILFVFKIVGYWDADHTNVLTWYLESQIGCKQQSVNSHIYF